ncbi:hypothetical protein ACQP1S_31000 [Micromonospora matsumotoense]|uniref:hypothetical protein n=1 Tax=Micromonospora matsumotoense TaxID=121616 RepID=UPI003D8CB9E7
MTRIASPQTDRLADYMAGGAEPTHFSVGGRWALVGDRNNAIHLWDVDSGRRVRTARPPATVEPERTPCGG